MYKFSRSQVSTARQTFYDKTRTCCISQRIRINHTCCQWEQKRCNQSLSRIRKNATKKKHSFKPRREGEKLFCRIEAGLKLKAVTQTTRLILWKHWAKISAKSNTFQLFLKKNVLLLAYRVYTGICPYKPKGLCFPMSIWEQRTAPCAQMLLRRTGALLLWLAACTDSSAHDCRKRSPTPFTLAKGTIHKLHKSSSQLSVDEKWAGARRRDQQQEEMSGHRLCFSL